MRIAILVASEDQKKQAGVRIRYQRIESRLKSLGHSLEILPVQSISSPSSFKHDVYLISKCYDARAPLIARCLRDAGKNVGVDLFDDYFSQKDDSRFGRLRYWLRQLANTCSFVLCSTPGMAEIARDYAPALPVHVMNDPGGDVDAESLAASLDRKVEEARRSRRINVAWFGMGDNPNFAVGLADLAAYGSVVDHLRGAGYDVCLNILTNRRAMTPANLAGIRSLGTYWTLDEWSEDRERLLLEQSLVSFLPVNAQNFSRIKSLNRAVTALSGATQVLSAGYPLYEPLAPFIYRDAERFLHDFRHATLLLRSGTVQQAIEFLGRVANAGQEAERLVNFLKPLALLEDKSAKRRTRAVIHGLQTTGDIHKLAQKLGALSVASPYSSASLNYDVRLEFSGDGAGYLVSVSSKKIDMVVPELRGELKSSGAVLATQYHTLLTEEAMPGLTLQGQALSSAGAICGVAGAYPLVMASVKTVLKMLFGDVDCIQAEQSKSIPWHVYP